jgi:S-adenosylmethionine decarboxylase
MNEITLFGFNNLTKSLSFSLYKLHYLSDQDDRYNTYIKEHYNADKLNSLLTKICHAIGGNVLNIAKQNYQPQGASVTLMISEEAPAEPLVEMPTQSIVAHLDKSHLCIHTYPEEAPQNGIAIFRADVELSTCGIISPLKVLNYVIEEFSADVIDIDYRIRGMTRDQQGNKCFSDHEITKISSYLSKNTLHNYNVQNNGLPNKNLFHCKLARHSIDLNNHLFEPSNLDLTNNEKTNVLKQLRKQVDELFLA